MSKHFRVLKVQILTCRSLSGFRQSNSLSTQVIETREKLSNLIKELKKVHGTWQPSRDSEGALIPGRFLFEDGTVLTARYHYERF